MVYQDRDGNTVHHFDVPTQHARLSVTAEALVERSVPRPVPDRLGPDAWPEIEPRREVGRALGVPRPERIHPRHAAAAGIRARPSADRDDDPLGLLHRLWRRPGLLRVRAAEHDRGLAHRRGPRHAARRVPGLRAHLHRARAAARHPRSVRERVSLSRGRPRLVEADATHAWVEAFLPGLDWVGFDPTNDLLAGIRHIRVAIGRDYADVPPTRGVYKGASGVRSELAVSVTVGAASSPPVRRRRTLQTLEVARRRGACRRLECRGATAAVKRAGNGGPSLTAEALRQEPWVWTRERRMLRTRAGRAAGGRRRPRAIARAVRASAEGRPSRPPGRAGGPR